jgi:hypothetical protein
MIDEGVAICTFSKVPDYSETEIQSTPLQRSQYPENIESSDSGAAASADAQEADVEEAYRNFCGSPPQSASEAALQSFLCQGGKIA